MSTVQEIEAQIAATQCHLTKRIDQLNERVIEMHQRIQQDIDTSAVRNLFTENKSVNNYRWNYEYSFNPGRRCFASDKLIFPGSMAYKGIFASGRVIEHNTLYPGTVFPGEIWLTKEEFTIRRLKGQI